MSRSVDPFCWLLSKWVASVFCSSRWMLCFWDVCFMNSQEKLYCLVLNIFCISLFHHSPTHFVVLDLPWALGMVLWHCRPCGNSLQHWVCSGETIPVEGWSDTLWYQETVCSSLLNEMEWKHSLYNIYIYGLSETFTEPLTMTIGLPKSSIQFCRVRQNHRSKWKCCFFCCGTFSIKPPGVLSTHIYSHCKSF